MSNLLFCNCRGLGSLEAVHSLSDLIHLYSPDIIFLNETKSWSSEMTKIQCKLNFAHGVWVDMIGKFGGITLLWANEVDVSIRSMGPHYIDFEVKCRGELWRGTGVYDWSESSQKWKT